MEKTSVQLSLEKSRTVRGYEIRRLPLGRYLEVVEETKALPARLMEACYPGKTAMQVLEELKTIDTDGVTALFTRLMTAMPGTAAHLLSVLTGIDEEKLLNDEDVGLDGAAELLEAFLEINRIENFIRAVRNLAGQIRTAAKSAGSRG